VEKSATAEPQVGPPDTRLATDIATPGSAWTVLLVALVAQIGVSVSEMGLPLLTGFIQRELGLGAATAGFAVSAFFFGKFLGSYAAGLGADAIGEAYILGLGGLMTGLLLVAAMLTPYPAIVAVLLVAGVASAGTTPAGGRMVRHAFAPERHGLALGIRQTGIPVGGLIAAAALPWIARAHGWRWSMTAAAMTTAGAAIPLLVLRKRFTPERFAPSSRLRAPINRNVKLLTVWACLVVSGQFAVLIYLPLEVHQNTSLSLAASTSLVAVAQLAGIAGRVFWGALSDYGLRRGRRRSLSAVGLWSLLATTALLLMPGSVPLVAWVAVTAWAGFALIGYQGLWITMVTDAADATAIGASTGFAVMFTIASIAIGPPILGVAVDVTGTYRAVWFLLLIAFAVSWLPASKLRLAERARSAS